MSKKGLERKLYFKEDGIYEHDEEKGFYLSEITKEDIQNACIDELNKVQRRFQLLTTFRKALSKFGISSISIEKHTFQVGSIKRTANCTTYEDMFKFLRESDAFKLAAKKNSETEQNLKNLKMGEKIVYTPSVKYALNYYSR